MSFVEVRGLTKVFGAVHALSNVSLSIERGVVHGLCGANGAGKSTLIRILAGAVKPDSGEVIIDGAYLREFTPQYSTSIGIGVVHQELALIPALPVYQNIFLGVERSRFFVPQRKVMKRQAAEILARMRVEIDLEAHVESLSLHHRQIVEIAKAVSRGTRLLILDEPTAVLNPQERQRLFIILRELKRTGLCILFITHFIDELFEACDWVTAMRDGRTVQTWKIEETAPDSVVAAMVGAAVDLDASRLEKGRTHEEILSLRHCSAAGFFTNVDLVVGKGEVVGLAGMAGSGCYEVAEALFGLRQLSGGEIRISGEPVRLRNPRAAAHLGIGFVPPDRRTQGLCLNLPASTNIALPSLSAERFSRAGILRPGSQDKAFERVGVQLQLHPLDPRLLASSFSGGNQQKLVLGRWIERGCRVYVFVEPTRGVDIGAKAEIWKAIRQIGRSGATVILVSTDFDDITMTCDRCFIFVAGQVAAELKRGQMSVDRISTLAIGAKNAAA